MKVLGVSLYESLRSFILPLQKINNALPNQGKIIDLGCGWGITTRFLAKEKGRSVIGVDLNTQRLPKKRSGNLFFINADIRTFDIKDTNGILLCDVLHHMNFNDQEKVLKNIAKGLKTGGILVIKEIDTEEFLRGKLSRFWDFVFYPGEKIYFSNSKDLKQKLENLKFKIKVLKASRLFPGSTTLYICQKC